MFKGTFKFVTWCLAVVVGLIAGVATREWVPSLAWASASMGWSWFLFIRGQD